MLKEFSQEWANRSEELTHAKEAIINGFPLRIDSNSRYIELFIDDKLLRPYQ